MQEYSVFCDIFEIKIIKLSKKAKDGEIMNLYLPEGALSLTERNKEYTEGYGGLERALEDGAIIEAPVVLCDRDFNLHIEFSSGIRGIIPKEEVLYTREGEEVKDIAILTRVGKVVCFKVTGFYDIGGTRVARLSRRLAQMECVTEYVDTLVAGDIIRAKVTHLESFGAFLDIGCGITSLLSIDSISVSRIAHPSARLSVSDYIYTVVKSIDESGRIYVSERELLGTWEENAALFSEGETVRGIIRSVESYGVFVELTPNLAGLAEYRDDVAPGEVCAVFVKSIIPEKMKIKLIIIDSERTELSQQPLGYFVDTEKVGHIDRWLYSPSSAEKKIETVF